MFLMQSGNLGMNDTIDITETETVVKNDEPALPNAFKKSTISGVGIRDFGGPVTDQRYNHVLDAKTNTKYRLHICYTSVRKVTLADGDPVYVFCKVLKGIMAQFTDVHRQQLGFGSQPLF